MSGLEGLGAAASVIGVIGVVKTCIDLLDIIASARSAERDLEDLLVHLQWQRIRFYCWIQETGFADIVVQQEDRPAFQASEMIHLLPPELRLPFILSHIKRSIENMSMRLKSAKTVLERYSTTKTSNCHTWVEKLRAGLNPELEYTSSITSPPRLNLFARLRWVAGDGKELTQLVDGLRKYNIELKELLPYYKRTTFERRVGIVLVTSRNLAAGIAATRPGSQFLQTVEEEEHFRQHQGVAQILQREYGMDSASTVSGDSDGTLSPCLGEDTTPGHGHICSSSAWTKLSLYRDASEFKFSDPSSTSVAREFSSDGTVPLIIEWRYYSTRMSLQSRSSLDARIHMLSMQLQQSSSLPDFSVLSCRGHFHDEKNHRYGIVFEYPHDCTVTTPVSLRDRLMDDHNRRVRRDLDDRFCAARILIATVFRLFSVNWFHKNICSSNILLFENNADSSSLELPYICGFDFARRDAQLELSETFPSHYYEEYAATEQRLYWHPDRNSWFEKQCKGKNVEGATTTLPRYRRVYDAYSLGILLLEIGLWCPVERIFKDCKTHDLKVFAAEARKRYVLELKGRMGRVYANIVRRCLEGDFGGGGCIGQRDGEEEYDQDDQRGARLFLEEFERLAVSALERPLEGQE